MANIVTRAIQSIHEGSFSNKLAVRRAMARAALFKRLAWVFWYLGNAPWQCRLKAACLRMQGAKVGTNLYLERALIIRSIQNITMESHVLISASSIINGAGGLTIEDYVMIGPGCRILTANHKVLPAGQQFRYAGHEQAPIHLKKGCWLGTNVIVLPGITVGEGAIVAAGAVVTKDVPDFTYVGGIPARFIKYREGYDGAARA